jgi:solute carrier family 6 (neurotransmitter transporter, glycine) member 5/9
MACPLVFVTVFLLMDVYCCLGLDNFCRDIEFMLGVKVGAYWRLCWGFVTPIFLMGILIYRLMTLEPITFNGKPYPEIAYGECN